VDLSRYTLGERALEREVLELFCVQSVVYLVAGRENERRLCDRFARIAVLPSCNHGPIS
jgi:hypothetical protein